MAFSFSFPYWELSYSSSSSQHNRCIKTDYIQWKCFTVMSLAKCSFLHIVKKLPWWAVEQHCFHECCSGVLTESRTRSLEEEVQEFISELGPFAERLLCCAAHSRSETVTRGKDLVIILHNLSDIYKLTFVHWTNPSHSCRDKQ